MENKIGLYVGPEREKWNTEQLDTALSAFKDLKPNVDESYGIGRGGFDVLPSLSVDLNFAAAVMIGWISAGIGSDIYKYLKKSLIKLYRTKLKPNPKNDPKAPPYLILAFTIYYESHKYIFYFPSAADEKTIEIMLKTLPDTVHELKKKTQPNYHLLSWEGYWKIDLEQKLDDKGFVINE